MSDAKVTVYLTAQDAFSSQLDAFKRKMGEVAGGMSFATSASARWEQGLRNLAAQQQANTGAMIQATGKSGEWGAGLNKAGNAVTNLAGNLLGANNQVSNIAEGLLSTFGVSGPVIAGVSAGIAATIFVVSKLTKGWREAQEAYDRYMDSLRTQSPLAIVGAQLDAVTEKSTSALQAVQTFFSGLLQGDVQGAFARQAAQDVSAIAALQDQYDKLFRSLKQQAFEQQAAKAAARAVAAFQEIVSQTVKAAGDFIANPAKGWNQFPKVLGDVNAEIATFGALIANAKDPLERLQLQAKLKELIALRAELQRVRAGSAFTASVGGDATRQGASAAEQQRATTQANQGGLSLAMQGRGGNVGLSDYGQAVQEQLRQFFQETADLIQTEFARTLGDAIGNAFQTAFTTGDPLKAIQAFGTTMLAGVGSIFVQLGQTYLKYGIIMKALAKLLPNPFTAGWAAAAIGVALIALGKALNAVAVSASGGSAGGGGGGGTRTVDYSDTQARTGKEQAGRMVFVVDENLGMAPLHPRTVQWIAESFAAALGMKALIIPKSAVSGT